MKGSERSGRRWAGNREVATAATGMATEVMSMSRGSLHHTDSMILILTNFSRCLYDAMETGKGYEVTGDSAEPQHGLHRL